MTDLEKNGIIPALEKILYECREIINPSSVNMMDKSDIDKEHSKPHLEWLNKVKSAIEALGLPADEEDEDDQPEPSDDYDMDEKESPETMIAKAIYKK